MELEVYEDQTGDRLYPTSKYPTSKIDKDEKIKRFFNNNVNLHIEKRGDKLTIHCHIIARKGLDRYQGYYIRYIDNYNDNSFSNFRKSTDKILRDLELEPKFGDIENDIFDNIQKFDFKGQHKEDIYVIIDAVNSNDILDYRAGNINEISALCNDILIKINNIKISISSGESNLGEINILRNSQYEESLKPTDNTKQIYDKHRNKKIAEKKRIELDRGKNKIIEGFALVREGANIFKNAGSDPIEIITEETNKIIGSSINKKTDGNEKIKISGNEKIKINGNEKTKKKNGEDHTIEINASTIMILLLVGIAIIVIISYFYNVPYISDIIKKNGNPIDNLIVPVPTETLPKVTKVATPVPTEAPFIGLYNITGYVKSNNKRMPNIMLILSKDNGVNDSTVTDQEGFYIFREEKNGTYTITIQNTTIPIVIKGSDVTKNLNLSTLKNAT